MFVNFHLPGAQGFCQAIVLSGDSVGHTACSLLVLAVLSGQDATGYGGTYLSPGLYTFVDVPHVDAAPNHDAEGAPVGPYYQ